MIGIETPREARWLDRLAAVRPDLGRMTPMTKNAAGRFSFLRGSVATRNGRPTRGFYCVHADLPWVIREVLRIEAEDEDERRRDIENQVGAFI